MTDIPPLMSRFANVQGSSLLSSRTSGSTSPSSSLGTKSSGECLCGPEEERGGGWAAGGERFGMRVRFSHVRACFGLRCLAIARITWGSSSWSFSSSESESEVCSSSCSECESKAEIAASSSCTRLRAR